MKNKSAITYQISQNLNVNYILDTCSSLTFPSIHEMLESGYQILEPLIGIFALKNSNRIGLILLEYTIEMNQMNIFSFYVHPNHRNAGIGKKLLSLATEYCRRVNVQSLNATVQNDWKSYNVFKHMMLNTGSENPAIQSIIGLTEITRLKSKIPAKLKFPPAFQLFQWNEISESDREGLQYELHSSHSQIPKELNPFHMDLKIAKNNSFGLRDRQTHKIIGWIIVYKMFRKDTLHYGSLYIHPNYRNHQVPLGLLLLKKALSIQLLENKVRFIDFIVTKKGNTHLFQLVQTYWKPLLLWLKEVHEFRLPV